MCSWVWAQTLSNWVCCMCAKAIAWTNLIYQRLSTEVASSFPTGVDGSPMVYLLYKCMQQLFLLNSFFWESASHSIPPIPLAETRPPSAYSKKSSSHFKTVRNRCIDWQCFLSAKGLTKSMIFFLALPLHKKQACIHYSSRRTNIGFCVKGGGILSFLLKRLRPF